MVINAEKTIQRILIASLKREDAVQSRARTNQLVINEYRAILIDGEALFPPIDVFYDGSVYRVADGIHRLIAANEAGQLDIECKIHQGGLKEAIIFAAGANSRHGLKRTSEDVEKAIEMIINLQDGVKRSERDIAKIIGIHHSRVNRFRRKLSQCDSKAKQGFRTQELNRKFTPAGNNSDSDLEEYSEKDYERDELRAALEIQTERANELEKKLALGFSNASEEEKISLDTYIEGLKNELSAVNKTLEMRLQELQQVYAERNTAIGQAKRLQHVIARKEKELSLCRDELGVAKEKIKELEGNLDFYKALENS